MSKRRKSHEDRVREALEGLKTYSFNMGLAMPESDLKHRLQYLANWLDNCPTEKSYDLLYHERLAMYNGYYAAACDRGLITKVE
jgi:hypothetical protein